MKTLSLLSAAALTLCSCSFNPAATISTGKDSNGNITTVEASNETSVRKEQTEKFNKIKIDGVFDCVYTQNSNNEYTITINGPKNIVELYEVKVINGQLHIDLKKGYRIKKTKTDDILVEITSPELNKLSNESVGKMTVENLTTGDFEFDSDGVGSTHFTNITAKNIEMDATGVGSTNIANLKAQTVDLTNSGVGNVDIHLDADNVVFENSGVGKISASGKAKTADMENSGVGSIEASGLTCETIKAENDGVGSIKAYVTKYAEYKNSGVGNVDIKGNGQIVKK